MSATSTTTVPVGSIQGNIKQANREVKMRTLLPVRNRPTEAEAAVAHRVYAEVTKHLQEGLEVGSVVRLVDSIHREASEFMAILNHHRDAKKMACKKGCDWCCYINVDASVPEVIALVAHIRATYTGEQLAELKQRVADAYSKTAGLDPQQRVRAHVPCPLLTAGGQCSVYQRRPLVCRGWNSTSVNSCKSIHIEDVRDDKVYQFAELVRFADAMQSGIAAGLRNVGLRPGFINLIAGLHILLNDPTAADSWLAGGDALVSASAEKDDR